MALMLALLAGRGVTPLLPTAGGAVLLGGGALIGMPHGSSDFVVAFRLMRPRLGGWWLPCFLLGYLAIVGLVLAGWWAVPTATFVLFLAVSCAHFGAGENGASQAPTAWPRGVARALTPVLPIFLLHPADVAGVIGMMSGQTTGTIVTLLEEIRPLGLLVYVALLGWVAGTAVLGAHADDTGARSEAGELVLLAIAAWLLPPFAVFAIYFCLLHAVRHMAHLSSDRFPDHGTAALAMAAAIVLPSALVCCTVLALAWNALAGALSTEHLLAVALQVTAALTVPHVLLECWAERKTHAVSA